MPTLKLTKKQAKTLRRILAADPDGLSKDELHRLNRKEIVKDLNKMAKPSAAGDSKAEPKKGVINPD